MKIYRMELVRTVLEDIEPKNMINAKDIAKYALEKLYDKKKMWQEMLYALFLDSTNKLIGTSLISMGGTSCCIIDTKIIAKYALESMASGVVIVHNHPTGEPQPSQADISQTQKLKKGLNCLDIKLLDHVILGENKYFSFTEEITKRI